MQHLENSIHLHLITSRRLFPTHYIPSQGRSPTSSTVGSEILQFCQVSFCAKASCNDCWASKRRSAPQRDSNRSRSSMKTSKSLHLIKAPSIKRKLHSRDPQSLQSQCACWSVKACLNAKPHEFLLVLLLLQAPQSCEQWQNRFVHCLASDKQAGYRYSTAMWRNKSPGGSWPPLAFWTCRSS